MRAILFDLDGTLLQLDFHLFLQKYTEMISAYCSSIADPAVFARQLFKSTGRMLANDGRLPNNEVFMQDFLPALNTRAEVVVPLLERFYTQEFGKLRQYALPNPLSAWIIEEVLDQGWVIVLATNPVFPRLAVEERMRWAGVDKYPWSFISAYEECHACKPNLLYYRELADKLGLVPGKCWMVGNDCGEDMVAASLGYKTYLVTDYLIDREGCPPPDRSGTLEELYGFVKTGLKL